MRIREPRERRRDRTLIGTATVLGCAAVVAWNATLAVAVAHEDGPVRTSTATPAVAAPALAPRLLHGRTAGERTVVLHGTGLDDVAAVSLGATPLGAPTHLDPTRISVRIGTAPAFAPRTYRIVLHRASGGEAVRTGVRFRYVAAGFRDRELRRAWQDLARGSCASGAARGTAHDCAHHANRALVAGGADPELLDVSSTALRTGLLAAGAEELRDTRRDRARLRLGDVVQLDEAPTSAQPEDRDRTGLVTGLSRDDRGRVVVRYSVHVRDGSGTHRLVERTLHRPGHDPRGEVHLLHLPS